MNMYQCFVVPFAGQGLASMQRPRVDRTANDPSRIVRATFAEAGPGNVSMPRRAGAATAADPAGSSKRSRQYIALLVPPSPPGPRVAFTGYTASALRSSDPHPKTLR